MERLTQIQIKALPTLLDIMEEISKREEFNNCDNSIRGALWFNKLGREDEFELTPRLDGWYQLSPISLNRGMCYRGQSRVYPEAKATIHRLKTEKDIFIENLYTTEFALLVLTHPIVLALANGIEIPLVNNRPETCKIRVDLRGLAQHYGFATEIIDFTTDKWVAAFFASSDCVKDKYTPVHDANRYGVFYSYSPNLPPYEDRIYPIGLQPFPRPGEQHALGLILDQNESLDSIDRINRVLFRQDSYVSDLIFNYSNRSNKLFPDDILIEKAHQLKNQKNISMLAFHETIKSYYNEENSKYYLQLCDFYGIKLVDRSSIRFTQQEISQFWRTWNKENAKKFFEKIRYRPVYINPSG